MAIPESILLAEWAQISKRCRRPRALIEELIASLQVTVDLQNECSGNTPYTAI